MPGRVIEPPASAPDRPDVFISYSRREKEYVESVLAIALEARGKDVWIDVEDIRGGASDWRATVLAGIEAAKVMIFVLTPESVGSRVCGEELAHAVALNKRIVPVLRRGVEGLAIPEALERPNWILARDEDDSDAAITALVAALETDEEWLDLHARLTQRTAEWLREDRDASFLLRGRDLRAAERWLDDQGTHAEAATPAQIAYVTAGRRGAARRQGLLLAGVALALGVSIVLGVMAYIQRQTARSEAFAAQAIDAARTDPEQGLILALRAAGLGHGPLVERALRTAVGASGWTQILREGTASPINDLAISPDGTRAVTGADDGRARVWDLRSGRLVASLRHAARINSVQFSPDGRRIVTAAADGTAVVWDPAGHALRVLPPGQKDVWSAVFDRRGERVITATDGAAQVWDLAGRGPPIRLATRDGGHLTVTPFSPDGRHALTSGSGASVVLWTISGRPHPAVLPGGSTGSRVAVAAFSPDGRRILTGDDAGRVCLWLPGRRPDRRCRDHAAAGTQPADPGIKDAQFSPDGRLFVTASGDATAVIGGAADFRLATLTHRGPVNTAEFSPAGDRVVTAGEDGEARIWTANGHLERALSGHTDTVTGARFSPHGDRVLTGSDDGSARVWLSAPEGTRLGSSPLPDADVAFSPDSRRLLGVDVSGRAVVWDLRSGAPSALSGGMFSNRGFAPCDRYTGCAPWSGNSRSIAGVDPASVAAVWDARTGARRSLGLRDASGAAFSPDGRRLAVLWADRPGVLVVDPRSARGVAGVPGGAGSMVEAARFSADGRLVLTVTDLGADGRREVRLSDAVRGTPAGPGASARDAGAAGSAAVRRDDAQLAVGTSAGALQTHDVRSGRRREATQGTLDITSVAYDPSGSRILTVGQDLTARVWNAGRLSAPAVVLRGHTGRLLGAEFSPDGRFVLTASTDGTARLWDSTLGTLVQVFDKSPNGGAGFSPDGRLVAIGGRATVEVHRCELCASLDGLVRIARARLPAG